MSNLLTVPKAHKFNWETISLLWFAFFFNQADRQIFNVVLPLIKEDLQLSDGQLGIIASVFIWSIGLFVPIAGYIGDIFSKKKVIMFSLLIWSSATFFTGFSTGLVSLIILRAIVGSSEAFYAPAANTLIGERYKNQRGLALSIHQTSLYAGVIMSGLLGAYIAELFGWRAAFYLFGGIGILLFVIIALRLNEGEIRITSTNRISFLTGIKGLINSPTAMLLTIAFSCMIFVNVGYLTWAPTFLHEKFNLSLVNAGFSAMFYHHIFAFLGVLVGGKYSDKLAVRNIGYRLGIQAIGLLFGAPFICLLGFTEQLIWVYVGMSLFGFFRGIYDSNIYASLFCVIAPMIRSSVSGAMIMFAFLTGAFSPAILGILKPTLGLSFGLYSLSVVYLIGAIAIFLALLFTFKKELVRGEEVFVISNE
ncbi:MAG: MFS transporter [Cyclobacteriaceae bacterium]|nr:MFS transporter [Cyclobacteriaceae bacterium]